LRTDFARSNETVLPSPSGSEKHFSVREAAVAGYADDALNCGRVPSKQ
jgi:hypothetical protein